jgi:hypothetical protein
MVAMPADAPVTSPLEFTDATVAFDEFHEMERPVRMVPAASRRVAVSCALPPTRALTVAGATVTVATGTGAGATTLSVAVPVTPSLVARMVALPAETPVAMPAEVTVETDVFAELQLTDLPVSTAPAESRNTTVNDAA